MRHFWKEVVLVWTLLKTWSMWMGESPWKTEKILEKSLNSATFFFYSGFTAEYQQMLLHLSYLIYPSWTKSETLHRNSSNKSSWRLPIQVQPSNYPSLTKFEALINHVMNSVRAQQLLATKNWIMLDLKLFCNWNLTCSQ